MSLLLLFQPNLTSGTGGGTTTTYPNPILLIKKGKLAVHVGSTGNVYLEL